MTEGWMGRVAPWDDSVSRHAPARKSRVKRWTTCACFKAGTSRARSRATSEVRGQSGTRGIAVHVRGLRGVLVPGVRVLPVVELLRELRELERMERVAHHGELVRLLHADRLLGEPRLRPVREPGRMQRDRADLDALARAEVAGDGIDHLLRLQVRVVIRDRN